MKPYFTCTGCFLYGDGRNFGGNDSVALTLNVLNNEAMFHGFSYHSPDEYWPLYIFYGKDTRLNLELNLGDPVKPDSLNAWTDSMMTRGHKIFISCDSKFSDNLLVGAWIQQALTRSTCTTMKQRKQGVMLVTALVFDLRLAVPLNESILNHFFPHFQPLVTYPIQITAFAERLNTWFLIDA